MDFQVCEREGGGETIDASMLFTNGGFGKSIAQRGFFLALIEQ